MASVSWVVVIFASRAPKNSNWVMFANAFFVWDLTILFRTLLFLEIGGRMALGSSKIIGFGSRIILGGVLPAVILEMKG